MYHRYTSEQLEKKANKILGDYKNGDLLLKPQALDVDDFAEFQLDLAIDCALLSNDGKTLGCMCFNDGYMEVWNPDKSIYEPISVQEGTLFIDSNLEDNAVEGRIRFTIMHECAHWILHRRFYYQEKGQTIPKFDYPVYRAEKWEKYPPRSDEDMREWQANRLAAALLMPASSVKIFFINKLKLSEENLKNLVLSPVCIDEMADLYKVSKQAMKYRLRDLGMVSE
ncbi:MAG: ImmA/IrrE family metallo-endopeptidase [Gallicola sp.]|nr:ImmA/IrrE family metallo-endopeptidase [Gallicola sp.]